MYVKEKSHVIIETVLSSAAMLKVYFLAGNNRTTNKSENECKWRAFNETGRLGGYLHSCKLLVPRRIQCYNGLHLSELVKKTQTRIPGIQL